MGVLVLLQHAVGMDSSVDLVRDILLHDRSITTKRSDHKAEGEQEDKMIEVLGTFKLSDPQINDIPARMLSTFHCVHT
jgi:hypothetical protein